MLFRAGRIDVVWGVELDDGREVVLKIHRPPVDVPAVRAAVAAQRMLAGAGFPAARPLTGPAEDDDRVLTAESLMRGRTPDGRDPADRRLLAAGLVAHIAILRERPDIALSAGDGPSWCRYRDGPWPIPHDTIVDLRVTVPGFEWLDAFARRASRQIIAAGDLPVVAGHGDWYAGNAVVRDGRLAGVFDWDLVAAPEAVLTGFAAAGYAASATAGGGLSTPAEAAAFLADADAERGRPLGAAERRAAAGAVAWIIAFNARWQVALIDRGSCDDDQVALARDYGEEHLRLEW